LENSYAWCTFSLKIARKGILVAERFLHILERHEILPHVSNYFKKFRVSMDPEIVSSTCLGGSEESVGN